MDRNPDFGTFGRFEETPADAMSPETRDAYAFTRELRGLVPGPHKIWLANPALSKTIVPTGAYFQARSTLTKAEIEIVTNLVNARWHASYAIARLREDARWLTARVVSIRLPIDDQAQLPQQGRPGSADEHRAGRP